MELGRTSNITKKRKHVIRIWCLERFGGDGVKLGDQNTLTAEVHAFSKSTVLSLIIGTF